MSNILLEIDREEQAFAFLKTHEGRIRNVAFHAIDFTQMRDVAENHIYSDCLFLGCEMSTRMLELVGKSCSVFPRLNKSFRCFRAELYSAETLYEGYELGNPHSYENTFDQHVYKHYIESGKETTDISETFARAIHDHSISAAMSDFLKNFDERKVVSIMGGHGLRRTDPAYKQIALISKKLTEKGTLMVSGGGPGAMEATHLGAWMAGRTEAELDEAISIMAPWPLFSDEMWFDSVMQVRKRFPHPQYVSLGVPTWLYGHEPSTPLATHIAKYFTNAIREDEILTIAKGGVIYSPGSAGTMQEIFQDAVQNHYLSFGYSSPMVFLNKEFWTDEMPVFPLLEHLVGKNKYKNLLLSICDEPSEVINVILDFANKK